MPPVLRCVYSSNNVSSTIILGIVVTGQENSVPGTSGNLHSWWWKMVTLSFWCWLCTFFLTVVRFLTNISFPFVKQIKVDLWKTSSIFFLPYISRTWKILDWWNKLMLGFSENPCHLWELSIPARCLWLAESFNLWVERMALTGGLRSLSGFAGEIVNSIGQRNLRSFGKVKEF